MFSLIIDTSTERGCALFFDGQQVLFQGHMPFGYNNSKYLLPEIERGFQTLGKLPQELDFVAVGIGPGSYTGIRVGVIVAKTLSFSLNIPLITFCSLEAFIPTTQNVPYATIFDAKIGGAYIWKGSENIPRIVPLEELPSHLSDVAVLVTPHAAGIKRKIENLISPHILWEESAPNALHLGYLTAKKWLAREYSDSKNVEILYLRKTQAEIEKMK